MSSLREALKSVKSDIRTLPVAKKKPQVARSEVKKAEPTRKAPVTPIRPKQYISGQEVKWMDYEGQSGKVPYIQQDGPNGFYVAYPTKAEDIKLPEGTVRASYSFKKKQVEYFKKGSNEVIRFVKNARHEPLPIPAYMSELESVEEIFDINLETGEIIDETRIDVLPEGLHWKLRLQEFETQQAKAGVSPKVITHRLQRYLKNLEALRGVTVAEIAQPIPESIQLAIEFAEKKRIQMAIGV
jgi:hypothetical protein